MQTLETRHGIVLSFEPLPEDTPLEDTFDDSCHDISELYADIEAGNLQYFTAHVIASKNDIVLGEDYLGCCLYNSIDEFINESQGYISDMKTVAYDQAIENIELLIFT